MQSGSFDVDDGNLQQTTNSFRIESPFDYSDFNTYTTLLNPIHWMTVDTDFYSLNTSEIKSGPDVEKFHQIMRMYVIINIL